MKRFKRSTIIPLVLFAYLLIMAYVGRGLYYSGEYMHYFGVIGLTLIVLVILHFSLKRKERLRKEREDDMYGKYEDDNASKPEDKENSNNKPN